MTTCWYHGSRFPRPSSSEPFRSWLKPHCMCLYSSNQRDLCLIFLVHRLPPTDHHISDRQQGHSINNSGESRLDQRMMRSRVIKRRHFVKTSSTPIVSLRFNNMQALKSLLPIFHPRNPTGYLQTSGFRLMMHSKIGPLSLSPLTSFMFVICKALLMTGPNCASKCTSF